jgi:hypothetical protein
MQPITGKIAALHSNSDWFSSPVCKYLICTGLRADVYNKYMPAEFIVPAENPSFSVLHTSFFRPNASMEPSLSVQPLLVPDALELLLTNR